MAESIYSKTVYVVMGIASQRPVATFTEDWLLARWLKSRRGTRMLRVLKFEANSSKDPVVLCAHCIIERYA